MSFAQDVKIEVTQNDLNDCCSRAQVSGFLSYKSIKHTDDAVVIEFDNPAIAKRIWSLLKNNNELLLELAINKKGETVLSNKYQIIIKGNLEVLGFYGIDVELLNYKTMNSIVIKDCCSRAYLAGLFLASGSVNSPANANYHLELKAKDFEHAEFVLKILERFQIYAKIIERRNKTVVYLKSSESISDFLRAIGSYSGLMKFEDQRIQRDFRNNFTRLDNCELANEVKSLKASTEQIEDINIIIDEGQFDSIDNKLRIVANIRLENPELNFSEIAALYTDKTNETITKSGIKHRFNRLKVLAQDIKDRKNR